MRRVYVSRTRLFFHSHGRSGLDWAKLLGSNLISHYKRLPDTGLCY